MTVRFVHVGSILATPVTTVYRVVGVLVVPSVMTIVISKTNEDHDIEALRVRGGSFGVCRSLILRLWEGLGVILQPLGGIGFQATRRLAAEG